MDKIDLTVKELIELLKESNLNPKQGLPESVFLLTSTLVPMVNIDLFIVNRQGDLLLSWRDDDIYGSGWHIPGGCVRLWETLDERIQNTAISEVGTRVDYIQNFIMMKETTYPPREVNDFRFPQVRTHGISFLYFARVPDDYIIDNGNLSEHNRGFIKWFSGKPQNLLAFHEYLYGKEIDDWFNDRRGVWKGVKI